MELISPYYPQLQILASVALAMVSGAVLGEVLGTGITILVLLTLRGVQVTARWFERR
jgi:hypothetical protein